MHVQNTVNQNVLLYVNLLLHVCGIKYYGMMITVLGLFIVVT